MIQQNTLNFSELTPEIVLSATENAGFLPTGEFTQLNSYENRVFDIKLENNTSIISKFYRPNRWSKQAIEEEHQFLLELSAEGIPAVAPLFQKNKSTLSLAENLWLTFFPKIRGRMPDEFIGNDLRSVGSLIARIHNVGSQHKSIHRPSLTLDSMNSWENLDLILEMMSLEVVHRYEEIATEILNQFDDIIDPSEYLRIHGDCHRGNLLHNGNDFFLVDFDDFVMGPVIQDFWMLLCGDDEFADQEKDLLISGYEELRSFPAHQWDWIPLFRGFRIINYAAWIARRWSDPSFPKLFPEFNTYSYWTEEVEALEKLILF